MTRAAMLAKSRTAWTAVATVAVSWLGRHVGLTETEQSTLITAASALVVVWYADDKAKGRR